MKIEISKLDKIFSKVIRLQRPQCEVCGRQATQIHHYFGRRYKSVRYSEQNVVSLCFTDHRRFHEDPEFGRQFMVKKLGNSIFDMLTLNKNAYGRPDYKLLLIYYNQILNKIEREEND